MTEFRIAWRLLRRLLRALGLRLLRWGDALTAGADLEQARADEQHTYLHVVAAPDVPARPGRAAARQGGKPALARLVRTERVSMPQQTAAPPAAPAPASAAKVAAPVDVNPFSRKAVRQRQSAVKRVLPGAPPGWQARAGQAGPPRDWLARVERAAPPDWAARVARLSAPAPQAGRVGRPVARLMASVLPRLRSAAPPGRVTPARAKVTASPPTENIRDTAPALPYPETWPVLEAGGQDALAPHFATAARADAPWPAPAPDPNQSRHGTPLPLWQEPIPTLRHHAAQSALTGPWPPLPPLRSEPDNESAAAALREHERLRRIDVEQRGMGWNAWLS